MGNSSQRQTQFHRSRHAQNRPWKRWKFAILGGVLLTALLASGAVIAVFFLLPPDITGRVVHAEYDGAVQALTDDRCPSGRIFFGSVNDAFPRLKNSTGIFLEQPHRVGYLRPYFKHESRNVYMTFTSYGYWVVGDGHGRADMRALSSAMRPDKVGSAWNIRVNHTWIKHDYLTAKCVDETFVTCRSGKLQITGISRQAASHARLMGNYSLLNHEHKNRPVYRHNKQRGEYLFFTGEFWSVNNEISAASLALFCFDNAMRPEYIVQSWAATNTFGGINVEENIKVTCLDNPAMLPPIPGAGVKTATDTDKSRCKSRRLFFGSVNHRFAQHQLYTGIFLLQNSKGFYGPDLYKHESVSMYMQRDNDGYWVVSDLNLSPDTTRIRSLLPRAGLENALWSVRDSDTERWRPAEQLRATCVDNAFRTCKGRKITLSGLTESAKQQRKLVGSYSLTLDQMTNRPVYRHDDVNVYLYHSAGRWVISNQIATGVVRMYTEDLASRAEYIMHPWVAWTGSEFVDQQIQVKCVPEITRTTITPMIVTKVDESPWLLHPECVVPFYYDGRNYTKCTDSKSNVHWCSTTRNYKGKWKYCKPRMMLHSKCKVPFYYKGRNFTKCTDKDYSTHWCSLTTTYNGEWELCNPSTIIPHVDCHFPFTYNGQKYSACTIVKFHHHWCATKAEYSNEHWVPCTNTGLEPHQHCVFPFTYRGYSQSYCVISKKGNSWCSTTPVYSGNWQYCKTIHPGF